MYVAQPPHPSSLLSFLLVARATALVRSEAIDTPETPPELSEAKYRWLVEKIETEQAFDKVDAQLSEIHDAFLQHILLRHESNTTLDGFANEVAYYNQVCAYRSLTGQDIGVLFDEEELALARSGFSFGKSIFKSPETPLAEPVFRAAKLIHLVIKRMPKGDQTATPAMPIFDACVRVKSLFMVTGILPMPPAEDIHALIRGLARASIPFIYDIQTLFMEYIHSRNFIHRDIKRDDPLTGIGKRGNQVNVIDCGLANTARNPKTHLHVRCLSPGWHGTLLITPVWKVAGVSLMAPRLVSATPLASHPTYCAGLGDGKLEPYPRLYYPSLYDPP
ncbi:serine/threonine protein kinase, partial [Ceratobasidium sp. 392]